MFFVVEKSDICNFADGNILNPYGSNLPLVLSKLKHNMENLLYWFRINSLKANPGKFKLTIIGKKDRFKHNVKIESTNIKEDGVVELLGIPIDKDLNFRKHHENLCRTSKYRLHTLRRIRIYMTTDKVKLLDNVFTDSHFCYAPVIWMLCHKTLYLKM